MKRDTTGEGTIDLAKSMEDQAKLRWSTVVADSLFLLDVPAVRFGTDVGDPGRVLIRACASMRMYPWRRYAAWATSRGLPALPISTQTAVPVHGTPSCHRRRAVHVVQFCSRTKVHGGCRWFGAAPRRRPCSSCSSTVGWSQSRTCSSYRTQRPGTEASRGSLGGFGVRSGQ